MLREIFYMGGYGIYVWPAYGITLFVLGFNLFFSLREKLRTKKFLKQFLSAQSHES